MPSVRLAVAVLCWWPLLAVPAAAAGAQEPPELRVSTRALELEIGGRVQTQFSTTSVDDAAPALWEVRRARLELGIRLNPLISARLNPEFAGPQVLLRDAFVQFDFGPATRVLVGQAFRPFSLLTQTSSVRILPIERGARIRGLVPAPLEHYNLVSSLGYADRDIGLQFRGEPAGAPLGLAYAAGVFNGPLIAAAGGPATYQLVARAAISPAPALRLGAAASRRHFAQPAPAGVVPPVRAGTAWQADLEYGSFARGPHLMAEAAFGALDPTDPDRRRFRAAQLWAAYRTRPATVHLLQVEPILRISHGDADAAAAQRQAGLAGGVLVTPGINLYFGPANRIMVNYDLWDPAGDASSQSSFRMMVQAAF